MDGVQEDGQARLVWHGFVGLELGQQGAQGLGQRLQTLEG